MGLYLSLQMVVSLGHLSNSGPTTKMLKQTDQMGEHRHPHSLSSASFFLFRVRDN